MEFSYLDDQISQIQDPVLVRLEDVPLVTPQSTLPESSGSTLKPPPGLAKPTEPMNYAAFMDECLNGRNYGTADMANSTFLNSGIGNLNSNLLASFNVAYNPLLPLSEAFIQFCKQRVEMELATAVNQFLLSNTNTSIISNTILNNSSTASSVVNTNPIIEQSCTNPFRSCQKINEQGISTATKTLEESTNTLMNLNINGSDHSNVQNGTTLPDLSRRDSYPLGFDAHQLFSSKSMEGFSTTGNEFAESRNSQSNPDTFINKWLCGANGENIANEEQFRGQQLHDTNPFKQHLIGSFDNEIKSRKIKEQTSRRDLERHENIVKPPIPPRNPNLINTALPADNIQQNIPTTKMYYQADPILYNFKSAQPNQPNSTLTYEPTEFNDSVSFHSKNHHDMKSSQDSTNHSLSKNILNNIETTNSSHGNSSSLHSGFYSAPNNAHTKNIFTPSTKFDANTTNCSNPRILSNSYRPPPPPYNENSTVEYLYKAKTPISPRFTSPLVSENSKAAIEEVQLATEYSFYEKLKSGIPETPGSIKGSETLGSFDACEEHTSSSSPLITNNNTNSELTSDYEDRTWPNIFYAKKFTLPKFLQEDQTTESSKQDRLEVSYDEKDLSNTPKTNPMPNWHQQQNLGNEKDSVHSDANCNLYSHQPFIPQFRPRFPNMDDIPPRPYYPMPYTDVRPQPYPPVGQGIPFFRPTVHGFYPPPPPHWPRPQFFNPAFPYMRNYCPLSPQPPYVWNPYNAHVFVPKKISHTQRTAQPNSQTTSQTDISRGSVLSSGLTHSPTLKQEIKENVDSIKVKETQIDASGLKKHTTDVPETYNLTDLIPFDISEELTNTYSNDTLSNQLGESSSQSAFKQEISSAENLPALPPRNNVDKTSNGPGHIPQQNSTQLVRKIFKQVEVNNQMIYLFNIENQGWVSTDEIAQVFTSYENRNKILRILDDIVRVQFKFMEVSRAQSPFLFAELDGTSIRLPRMTNSKKIKGTLHLTPLNSLKQMMFYLGIISMEEIASSHLKRELPPGSKLFELLKLTKAYSSGDQYWIA